MASGKKRRRANALSGRSFRSGKKAGDRHFAGVVTMREASVRSSIEARGREASGPSVTSVRMEIAASGRSVGSLWVAEDFARSARSGTNLLEANGARVRSAESLREGVRSAGRNLRVAVRVAGRDRRLRGGRSSAHDQSAENGANGHAQERNVSSAAELRRKAAANVRSAGSLRVARVFAESEKTVRRFAEAAKKVGSTGNVAKAAAVRHAGTASRRNPADSARNSVHGVRKTFPKGTHHGHRNSWMAWPSGLRES
jgi:hypothetical protein